MFALIFWPHVTIFCIFWLHECLKWRLEFNSKSLFYANLGKFSRYERLNSTITNFSWYTCLLTNSDHDIIPMAYHPCMFVLNFCSKQICNVEALICHFYKTSKLSRKFISLGKLVYFVHGLFFTGTIRGLHQMRKDLVLCALWRDFLFFFFFSFRILGQNQEKVSFLIDLHCSKGTKQAFIELKV